MNIQVVKSTARVGDVNVSEACLMALLRLGAVWVDSEEGVALCFRPFDCLSVVDGEDEHDALPGNTWEWAVCYSMTSNGRAARRYYGEPIPEGLLF